MVNIVFMDVNKLEVNFEPDGLDETSKKLNQLKDNILRLVGSDQTLIEFIARDQLEAVKYNAALLINYFNAITVDVDNIMIGSLLTSDAIADLCVRADANTGYFDSDKPVQDKQSDEILAVGKDNISKVVHITNGVEYFLLRRNADLNNISMYTGFDYPKSNIDYYHNTVFLISKQSGMDGFNDCFATYFAHEKEHPVRSKKKPENNQ